MRTLFRGVVLTLLSLAGCSSKDPIFFHSVSLASDPVLEVAASDQLPYNLGIEPFTAVSELSSLNLLVRASPEIRRYQTYEVTQLWCALPASMVEESAEVFFESRFASAETYPGSYVSDLILRAQLTHFEEIRQQDPPVAFVGLKYQILVRQEATSELPFERVYEPLASGWVYARGQEPLPERGRLRDGSDLTVALTAAMKKAFDQIYQKCVEHQGELPKSRGEFRGP